MYTSGLPYSLPVHLPVGRSTARGGVGGRRCNLPGTLVVAGEAFARPLYADLVQLHACASSTSWALRLALRMSRQAEPTTKTSAVIRRPTETGSCRKTIWSPPVSSSERL